MNYKQAKKHFKNEWQKTATEIDHLIYPKGSIDVNALRKWVSEDAKTDEGMPKKYALLFHVVNPNGLANQFPKSQILSTRDFYFINEEGEKRFATGHELQSNKFDNYYYEKISNAWVTEGRNFSWWNLEYALDGMRKDIERSWRTIADSKFPMKAKEIAEDYINSQEFIDWQFNNGFLTKEEYQKRLIECGLTRENQSLTKWSETGNTITNEPDISRLTNYLSEVRR